MTLLIFIICVCMYIVNVHMDKNIKPYMLMI